MNISNEFSPDSWRSLNTQLVVLLAMAALPSIWSFLAAFPAVIWSLDWTRTNPGWSTISNICFVFPSFSFWPIFNSINTHNEKEAAFKTLYMECTFAKYNFCTLPGVEAMLVFFDSVQSWKTKWHKLSGNSDGRRGNETAKRRKCNTSYIP